MNANLESVLAASPIPWAKAASFVELVRPRLTALLVTTTLVGFYMGASGTVALILMLHTLVGTTLVASGASAFNMYLERNLDGMMRRTFRRPLPSGRLQAWEALAFATTISLAGIFYLFTLVNPLTSLVSAAIIASYLLLYTPLKKRTWLCTLIGAVPGALPASMGWAASSGSLSPGAWILFAIVFFWQLPHFYAIGWMYREDYARAGYSMLAVLDSTGSRTSRQSIFFIALLMIVSTVPWLFGRAGIIYLSGALLLGMAFLAQGISFARSRDHRFARRLFAYSLFYLPSIYALLVIDKITR